MTRQQLEQLQFASQSAHSCRGNVECETQPDAAGGEPNRGKQGGEEREGIQEWNDKLIVRFVCAQYDDEFVLPGS